MNFSHLDTSLKTSVAINIVLLTACHVAASFHVPKQAGIQFEPQKQHFGGSLFDENEELEMAVRKSLRIQEPQFYLTIPVSHLTNIQRVG